MQTDLLDYNTNIQPKTGGLLIDTLQTIIFALAISIVMYLFIATPNQVDGLSMYPNLHNNDILLTNKFIQIAGGEGHIFKGYDYKRGDMVVFQEPNRPDLVKRIIGLPGETIKVEGGRIFLNDEVLVEEYIPADVPTEAGQFLAEGKEKTIPPGSYAVFGDNRTNSKDSRTLEVAFVKREYLKGSPFLRIFPLSDFGLLRTGKYKLVPEQGE
jgi:signal peptidase I